MENQMESGTNNFESKCPLCKSERINNLLKFDSKILIDLYIKSYGLDIKYLINDKSEIGFYQCKECSLKYFYPDYGGDDFFYSNLQIKDNYYFNEKYEYEVVKKYFNNTVDVLEVGSGKGAFSKLINYKSYTGLELNESAVKLARNEGLNLIHTSVQDYEANNQSIKYDIICSFQVLEHVFLRDLHSFIESSIRLLKSGGKMIIVVPSESTFMGNTSNSVLNLPPHHLTRWSDECLNNIGKIFNLKIIDINYEPLKKINYNPYFIQLIRKVFLYSVKVVSEKDSIIEKAIRKFVKHLPFSVKEKIIKSNKARGHSIIIIYEKK